MYMSSEFGPGKYFIGDICYALPDKIYHKVWGDKYKFEDGFYKEDGFAVHGTAYGDGCYFGTDGVRYMVDAGVIGITNITNAKRYSEDELNELGKIVEVKDSISMECDDEGNFDFIVDGEPFIISTGED